MDTARQFEICQEARFVLWALRCAIAGVHGDSQADAEIARGFELADVPETAAPFRLFAGVLATYEWPQAVWHHPRCCCVSTEEMFVLQALADTAERQRLARTGPGQWWRLLLPQDGIPLVDSAARTWLMALNRAGVVFPSPAELVECLRPMENIAQPAPLARVH